MAIDRDFIRFIYARPTYWRSAKKRELLIAFSGIYAIFIKGAF